MDGGVCSTRTAYHYFLHGEPDASRLAAEGLSARPVLEEERELQREVYAELFAPLLGRPFVTSGVFCTPIDFHALPGSLLASRPRVAIDVDRLDPSTSVLTWQLDGPRVRLPLTGDALARAAQLWTAELVGEWFARNRRRLFWHVPQIGCFGAEPIAVGAPEWPPSASGVRRHTPTMTFDQ